MNKKKNNLTIFLISLFFIIWIFLNIYLYYTWFDFKNFFFNLDLKIEFKIWLILVIYFFRNYLFIPSSIIILFSRFLLQDFFIALAVNIIWVSIWIFQTYFVWYIFSNKIEWNTKFKTISKYNEKIQTDWFKAIFIWAFFPIIPVDLFYYSAWLIKYSIMKTFLAWLLWELPLIILYSFLWKEAEKYTGYFLYIWIFIVIIFIIYLIFKKNFKKIF